MRFLTALICSLVLLVGCSSSPDPAPQPDRRPIPRMVEDTRAVRGVNLRILSHPDANYWTRGLEEKLFARERKAGWEFKTVERYEKKGVSYIFVKESDAGE